MSSSARHALHSHGAVAGKAVYQISPHCMGACTSVSSRQLPRSTWSMSARHVLKGHGVVEERAICQINTGLSF
jgi:hypothetical protein